MKMKFYGGLYCTEALKEKEERILKKLKKNRYYPGLYLLVLAQGRQNHLEFFSALLLKQRIFEHTELFVVGIADGYMDALYLVERIASEVYRETNQLDIRNYILDRQRDYDYNQNYSGEGSV